MIVVGVVGCLAALAFPNFIKARSSSHRSVCIANLKQIHDAKITWSMEYNKDENTVPADSDLYGPEKYLRYAPACPSQGTYAIGPVKKAPLCTQGTAEGHTL